MKKRLGFISNSSSSSFICCYAKIIDEEKALKYLEETKEFYEILTTEEAIKKGSGWSDYGADWAGVFDRPMIDEDNNYKYLIFESCGGAGDGDHDFDPECQGDYNYDVGYDDFDKSETDFIDGVSEATGFTDIEVGYGAGRNG